MKLLAIETATQACSVAVYVDGEVHEAFGLSPNRHSQCLLPMVEQVLGETGLSVSQCDALAFGRGPGSFTGLRIGAAVIQGMAFGAGLPVIPVSSLAALAQGQQADRVLAAFDARMDQVYWGSYRRDERGFMVLVGEEAVGAPEDVTVSCDTRPWVGAGSGWDEYGDRLKNALGHGCGVRGALPHAADVARLAVATGRAVPPELALPTYLRDEVTRKGASTARR